MGCLAAFVLDLKSAKIETPAGIAFSFFFFFKHAKEQKIA